MKSLRVLVLILCASAAAFAGDREFHGLVRSFETAYGVHHARIRCSEWHCSLRGPWVRKA